MMPLIKEIFVQNKFSLEENLIDNVPLNYKTFFAKRMEDNRFDFYLILEIRKEDLDFVNLEENLKDFFEIILEKQQIIGIDKNLSLLLLIETDNSTQENEFNKKAFDFEENPFYFKKFILPYTREQYSLLHNFLNKEEGLEKQLNRIVSNKEYFNIFKKAESKGLQGKDKIYDLVSRLFIKIPFLVLKVSLEKLPDLSKEIHSLIPEKEKKVIDKLLLMEEEVEWNNVLNVLGVEFDGL